MARKPKATKKTVLISARVDPEFRAAFDAWLSAQNELDQSTAIRIAVERLIRNGPYRDGVR